MTPTTQAVILLSRGGYSYAPQTQLNKLVAALQAARSDVVVVGAMVEKGQPSLLEALQQCAEAGVRHITVLPIFLPGDDNLQRWLARVIKRWHRQWRGVPIETCLADSLGNHPALQSSVVEATQYLRPYIRNVDQEPPNNWQTDPASWSHIPDHKYHILFCQGPRCTALGAGELATHLRDRLKAHKLTHDDRVLVVQSSCLYPCNLGAMMVVYPEGVWYGNLTKETITRIVQEHFIAGQVVAEHVQRTNTGATDE